MTITTDIAAADYTRTLEGGLIARWSTAADTENIAELISSVFREKEEDEPNHHLAYLVKLLMSGKHPVMGPGDYAIVEDPNKEGNPVIAGVCLQRMEWSYEGIPFLMSRPEIVAADPAYRNRGLIRILFEFVHARSAAEGRLVDAITGIPYFYRQFGYEYALELEGARGISLTSIPKAKTGETEPYTLREATLEDVPALHNIYTHSIKNGYVITTTMDENYLRWTLEEWKEHPERIKYNSTQVIINSEGTIQGWLYVQGRRRDRSVNIWRLYMAPHVNQQAIMPSLLRALQSYGQQLPTKSPETEAFSEIKFCLGEKHDLYDVLGTMGTINVPAYAWYIRVADLPGFIQHIAPALEKRLLNTPVEGYSGELKLDFYRGGLRLVFEQGRLTTAENWRPTVFNYNADGGFPPLVFLKALFGYRSLNELRQAYPDVWVNNEILFNTLFPAKPSMALVL
ncbi:hypothetical protein KDW_37440 [Dictyobacter vulcani]|uniref:N-acetyltransferase domain-containing protein n=1 Tax=Dictyobacter vulcani TaxID=2607529 RepID=A0A5J4KQU8_9CHLR|nr:GNAT family N-acetyltransferase [Dictyobacter vulcani]GER89582.1 hypothetical protein KDW_37440 [Dictyobacter vulcani]